MNSELLELYETIHAQDPELEQCPPKPSPLMKFDAGGQPSDPPKHSDERARCSYCDYRGICEGSEHEIDLPLEARVERFGHAWPVTPIAEVETRASVVGEVVGLQGPELQDDGSISLEFTLQDGYDRARVRPSRQGNPRNISRGISEGSRVRVDNGVPSVWRGQLQIDLDENSSVSMADERTWPQSSRLRLGSVWWAGSGQSTRSQMELTCIAGPSPSWTRPDLPHQWLSGSLSQSQLQRFLGGTTLLS